VKPINAKPYQILASWKNVTIKGRINVPIDIKDLIKTLAVPAEQGKHSVNAGIEPVSKNELPAPIKIANKKAGKGFGYSLFNSESSYTNTLSARYYKDGSEILISQKNKNPRKITPREAARLQGFPDQYIIPVSNTQAYKQFGNSVAVPVIYAIANQILNKLNNDN